MSYRGAPYDEGYFIGNSEAGYTDYSKLNFHKNRADDIEQFQTVDGINVLVIGCAFGFLVKELADRGAIIKGVDISSYAISQAQLLFPSLDFEVVDALNTNEGNNQYDLVIANLLVDCMPDTNTTIQLLQEVKRVLRNHGVIYMLVSTSNPFDYLVINDVQYQTLASPAFPSKTIKITDVSTLPISADRRVVIS